MHMPYSADIQTSREYFCKDDINLYESADCKCLVTQAKTGRHLVVEQIIDSAQEVIAEVRLCEDDYPGWLSTSGVSSIVPASDYYEAPNPTQAEISAAIPHVIRFAQEAMTLKNTYLWGGTVGPNYDCSGLVQTAFLSAGIQLPRDSYQQEHFVTLIGLDELKPGDLLFFGSRDRTTHVALYLGNGKYIHSSGRDQGRNGIGIDSIEDLQDPISRRYYEQLRSVGRVVNSYQPANQRPVIS